MLEKESTDDQLDHWNAAYERMPNMFGPSASSSALYASDRFRNAGVTRLLELGSGHGRDSLRFAQDGFDVLAMDYSSNALNALRAAATEAELVDQITAVQHDVRLPIPVPDRSVPAVYAHLLLCMSLSTDEIVGLVNEIERVLIPGGILVYTVRNTTDAHFGRGIDHGDNIFETDGYAVHFFNRALVDRLAGGWVLDDVISDEEGPLPKKIWRVTQTSAAHTD